ncbi:MAG TPA: SDR family oxidoreductase [Acidimicrobiales bacterium]|nr:SDR family oxidoreductase [Acidimicrobiales bacterium]
MNKSVIVITGASAGIGRECAAHLANSGWTVIGGSRRGTSNGSWRGVQLDVDRDDSVEHVFEVVDAEYGRLNAVLACAGWGLAGAAENTTLEDARAQFETNFWGVVRVVRAALPRLREQGGGRIIVMSSIGGILGIPYQAFYSASKFALEGFVESLAYEVAPFNIQVTLVEPGNFKTDFTAERRKVEVVGADPYRVACDKAIAVMESDETNGADPADVARVVEKILRAKNPPRRVSVGKLDERLGIISKRLLPFRLFEKAAKGSLGV